MRSLGVYRNGCKGKIRHKTEKRAMTAARLMAVWHKDEFNHYLCAFCGKWHVGHTQRRNPDWLSKPIQVWENEGGAV
jgi:hypothetical protein